MITIKKDKEIKKNICSSTKSHHRHSLAKNLSAAIILNLIIVVGELIGGLISNSLALISDALHNLGDLIALVFSLIAAKLSLRKASPEKSYGFVRSEIIVAFINSSALLLIGGYVIYQGITRLILPEEIAANIVIVIAAISFFANGLSSFLLHSHSAHDLNAKSSYLHLMFDALHSLGAVVAGILILLFNWIILDSIVSILIGIFIFREAWKVVLETADILNESTPKEIDHIEVENFLKAIPEIKNIHHLHIWKLSSNNIALTAHLVIVDQLVSQSFLIIHRVEKELLEKFGINHPTFQIEAESETLISL
jgi:cobalt-zinc-cadmium efflux system protein